MTAPGTDRLGSLAQLPRPFERSYGVSLATAVLSLVPYIILTTAYELFSKQVGSDLHIGKGTLQLISALGTAGYAFGAMVGGDVIQRFRQRRLFLICEAAFVAGCLLAATATGTIELGAGMVITGLTTGLLLVVALPPVVRRFPPERMPITSAAIDIGFFGAVTVGPLIGGGVAATNGWRWLFAAFAALGLLIFVAALFTLPSQPPPNPDQRFDSPAIALALASTVLPFWASAELTRHTFHSYWFMVPLAVGFACLVAMLMTEFHIDEPLAPVKTMWHTVPLVGTMVAMVGGGAYISFLSLAERLGTQAHGQSPLSVGLSFWPQVLGVILASAAVGWLVRTRWLAALCLLGMLLLIGGGALLLGTGTHVSSSLWLLAAALLGLGAGATVSPGLWLAAFSLPSKLVGRTFALVELVRSEADFILAPVMLQVAQVSSDGKRLTPAGIENAIWVTILITIAGTGFMTVVYLAGGAGLPLPDLKSWLQKGRTAIHSPALGAALRPRRTADGKPST